jgi:hypothetical protein
MMDLDAAGKEEMVSAICESSKSQVTLPCLEAWWVR